MNRRNFLMNAVAVAAGVALAGCARAEETPAAAKPAGKKPLVVYYSWSGNTRALAKQLAKLTGGDLFELVPETPYPTVYHDCTDQAKRDIQAGLRPALKSLPDLAAYDTLLVGSPNWWGTVAPPVSTFLENPGLAGKTVALFVTHGGGGMQNCERDAKKQCPKATMPKALAVSGSRATRATAETAAWLKALGLIH